MVFPDKMEVAQAPGCVCGISHPPLQASSPEAPERAYVLAWVPIALLSRLPAGHLCCLGIDLLHLGLVMKVSVQSALLGEREPVLGPSATGSANLQAFLQVFCCFT
jgi:hypothetical protein